MDYDGYYEWQESTNEFERNDNNNQLNHSNVANSLTEYYCQSSENDKDVYLVKPADAKRNSNGSRVLTRQHERTGSNRVESNIYDELEYDSNPSTQDDSSHTSRKGVREIIIEYLKKNKILMGAVIGIILIMVVVVGIAVSIKGGKKNYNTNTWEWVDGSNYDFTNWNSGQPDGGNWDNQQCITYWKGRYLWHDRPCHHWCFVTICKK